MEECWNVDKANILEDENFKIMFANLHPNEKPIKSQIYPTKLGNFDVKNLCSRQKKDMDN